MNVVLEERPPSLASKEAEMPGQTRMVSAQFISCWWSRLNSKGVDPMVATIACGGQQADTAVNVEAKFTGIFSSTRHL